MMWFAFVFVSGDVEVLRMQVSVRSDDVGGRDQQVGERAGDSDRVQDRGRVLSEKRLNALY